MRLHERRVPRRVLWAVDTTISSTDRGIVSGKLTRILHSKRRRQLELFQKGQDDIGSTTCLLMHPPSYFQICAAVWLVRSQGHMADMRMPVETQSDCKGSRGRRHVPTVHENAIETRIRDETRN